MKQEDKEALKKFNRRWFYTRALRGRFLCIKTYLQRVEHSKNIQENQRVRVDCKDAKDPGNAENGQEDRHRLRSQPGNKSRQKRSHVFDF